MPRAPRALTAAPTRGNQHLIEDSSDDDFAPTPPRARRLAGGGARGAPLPVRAAPRGRAVTAATRGRAGPSRRGGANTSATRGRTTGPSRRGGANTAVMGGGRIGPIFGGRQNNMLAHAARNAARLTGAGQRATRVGQTRAGGANDTIVLGESEEEDSDEEGEDVEFSDDEEEELIDGYDYEDSFIDDEGVHYDPFVDALGVLENLFPESDDDYGEDDDDVEVGGGLNNPAEETFSREVEEFELMEERENKTAKRAEERLRKKEDKEEKENKQALRTDMFGACTVCAEDEVTDPVGCIHCANFIGCRKCAKRWYRMSKTNDPEKIASCPLCRHKWVAAVPEVGDMLDLVKTA